MTMITILGDSLAALAAAHHVLDTTPEADINIITEKAEVGLIGEVPGLISTWPPCPSHWISENGTHNAGHTYSTPQQQL